MYLQVRAWDVLRSGSDDRNMHKKWGFRIADYPVYHCATSFDGSTLAIAGGNSEPEDEHDHSHDFHDDMNSSNGAVGCCDNDDSHMRICPVHLFPIPRLND